MGEKVGMGFFHHRKCSHEPLEGGGERVGWGGVSMEDTIAPRERFNETDRVQVSSMDNHEVL